MLSSKQRLLAFGSIMVIATMLAACGSSGGSNAGTGSGAKGATNSLTQCPKSTNTTAASAQSGTINLTVAGFASTPAEDALVQQGLNAFMSAHPNIHVTWTAIPGDYPTKMRANVASGNVPDVFYVQPPMAQEYIPSGKLLNLSPYMAHDNIKPSSFYSSLEQPFDCTDGTIFGIPKDWNSLGLFYNTTMFQQAGISAPTDSWTWTDLQNAAQKLTKNGVVGLSLPADASRFGAFLYENGAQMLDSSGKPAFTSQAGIDAATFYTSFQTNHTGAQPTDLGASWDGDAFGQGKAAMTFEGGWMIPSMASSYPKVQYGIAPLPKSASTGQRSNLVYTNAWGAYSGTKHPEAAWEVIKYMTGAAYQKQVLDDGFALPSITSLSNDPYFQQNPNFNTLLTGATTNAHPDFYGAVDNELHTDVANALQSVMLGKSSVKDALDGAATKINTWISQNEAP